MNTASVLLLGISCSFGLANPIEFEIEEEGRVSLGVFDKATGRLQRTLLNGEFLEAGEHQLAWDGLDHRGQPVASGSYEWRSLIAPGFTARYVTTIGINPPGGEHPIPKKSWVGDHLGAGIVDVDETGIYVGSPITEGGMMMVKIDRAGGKVIWRRPQFYQGGRLTRAAGTGRHLFMLHPNGKLRRLAADSGRVEAEWDTLWDEEAPSDIDGDGENLVVAYQQHYSVRWLSTVDGKPGATVKVPDVTAVAVVGDTAGGDFYAAGGKALYRVRGGKAEKVLALPHGVTAMDYDARREQLWVAVGGHQVLLVDSNHRIAKIYGAAPRPQGAFDPRVFAGVGDIAADLEGGFLVAEPAVAPRRVARFDAEGSLRDQWFGGMSFYLNACFDPEDPSRLFGIAPEGWVNEYRIDYEAGSWEIVACYQTGRLGDSLFPFSASFRALRKNGELFLYHRVIPAVLRLDAEKREAIPVAIAGRVLNSGRSFHQFAGSGEGGYPEPWVAAAKHYGYGDLDKAPALYSWADSNGNGEFEPAEFRFSSAHPGVGFHNAGDFMPNGHFIVGAKTNAPHALVEVPVSAWEGPDKTAPRWDWDRARPRGEVIADPRGYGSPRSLSVAEDGSVALAYQAGLMIKGHGQYEGGGWPEHAVKGCRVLGFSADFKPRFSVGRQSRTSEEANSGFVYYPMGTMPGPNRSVVVNDQTKQAAQVWTLDGLFVGGVLENRTDDGLADGFYQLHGDDNQGGAIVTAKNGRTYWLMPYQGHNRLYEISGWDGWTRASGDIDPVRPAPTKRGGAGLKARYTQAGKVVVETTEAPIYYEPFGGERHGDKLEAPYQVEWGGQLEAPMNDRYRFSALLGKGEWVTVSVGDKIVFSAGNGDPVDLAVDLVAAERTPIRIDYHNPDGRAELKLFLRSRSLDPTPLQLELLYP